MTTIQQKRSGYLDLIFSIVSLGVLATWVGELKSGDAILFWHPILMTAGFILSFVWATLSLRLFPFGSTVNRVIHGLLHCATVVFWSVGLFYGKNKYDIVASVHSWLGVAAIIWCGANFFLGLGLGCISLEKRSKYSFMHISLGILAVVFVAAAMESGIIEHGVVTLYNRYYYVPIGFTGRSFPFISHCAAILVLCTLIFTLFALVDVSIVSVHQNGGTEFNPETTEQAQGPAYDVEAKPVTQGDGEIYQMVPVHHVV